MRLLNIASGSSGNSTYIGNDDTHILVDAGISRKRIVSGLHEADLDLKDLSAILITHEHIDHIGGLGVLARSLDVPIFATAGTIAGIQKCRSLGSFNQDLLVPVEAGTDFSVGNITVTPLSISHDAADPVCFRFADDTAKAAIVTDLGEYDAQLEEQLQGLDMLMLEANHDIRMLEVGPYPYPVKQRILSRLGHLSNEASGKLLSDLLHDHIKQILLAHISRENNTRELAHMAVCAEIDMADNPYVAADFEVRTARPDCPAGICCT